MSLESAIALLKGDVSDVSAVQASNRTGLCCYATDTDDVSAVSADVASPFADTADTARYADAVSRKPAQLLGCTADTADTAQNNNVMRAYRVLVAMPHGDLRPPRWIVMLAPGYDLTQARESAERRFIGRVLDVVNRHPREVRHDG